MEKISARSLAAALFFTFLAILVHVYLARHFYALEFGLEGATSACNINATFNCDAVALSSWAVFLGVPLAAWAAATNGVLFSFLLVTLLGWTSDRPALARISVALATLVAFASVVMGAISLLYLRTYCLFCLAAYALSFLTCFFAWYGAGFPKDFGNALGSLHGRNKWVLGMLCLVPVAAFAWNASAVKSVMGDTNLGELIHMKLSDWQSAPAFSFELNRGLVREAQGEAKMEIVEFADFLCPHCRHAAPPLHAFASAHPDVTFVFKAFPLIQGVCGEEDHGIPGLRCRISAAVQCEERLGRNGWEAQRWFFEHQEEMAKLNTGLEAVESYCRQTGRDCAPLVACATKPETMHEINDMMDEGMRAGVDGTPSVFVNGRRLDGGTLPKILEAAYQSSKAQR